MHINVIPTTAKTSEDLMHRAAVWRRGEIYQIYVDRYPHSNLLCCCFNTLY